MRRPVKSFFPLPKECVFFRKKEPPELLKKMRTRGMEVLLPQFQGDRYIHSCVIYDMYTGI